MKETSPHVRVAGVMSLPRCVLFPMGMIPLFIFEPRYQLLLRNALAGSRMFASVNRNEAMERNGEGGTEPIHEVGTLGMIRACRRLPDGSAHVILQGISRIKVRKIVREEPYRMIALETLDEVPSTDDAVVLPLRRHLEDLMRVRLKLDQALPEQVLSHLQRVADPSAFVDLAASTFCSDAQRRQMILETVDMAARYRMFIRFIQEDNERRLAEDHFSV